MIYFVVTISGNSESSKAVKIWEVSSGKQLITFPTSYVAAFSPDWKSILLTSGNVATILKPFNSTQELIDAATKSIPEGLNIEDWKERYLTD